MIALVALSQAGIFMIGTGLFIAVFTAALSLAYLRFDELGEGEQR